MVTEEKLLSYEKETLPEAADTLDSADIKKLVDWLAVNDDTLRYHSFLLLKHRSEAYDDVYPYWGIFCEKLGSSNSYQRSLGVMLIAANAKWDTENKMDIVINEYLAVLGDEKPITVRQCIQALEDIVPYKRHLLEKIADSLTALELDSIKETMRKSILVDILTVLAMIKKQYTNERLESYIISALSGGILDRKSVRQIESLL
ncbi:MAG TPA: hypothetical protein VN580_04535 [Clostridia bacterium]|nr:hypothetical protein [Clostridia bacterium]